MKNRNPDAELFQMIERNAKLMREFEEADELSLHASSKRQREAALSRLENIIAEEIDPLRRRIATYEVKTPKGFEAKCEAIGGFNFDTDEWVLAGFALGMDAQRLQINPAICFKLLAARDREAEHVDPEKHFADIVAEFLSAHRAAA